MENFFVKLGRVPTVQLSCTFSPGSKQPGQEPLIVFLNGINIPQVAWFPVATILKKGLLECPPMLMYDRVGQGASVGRNPEAPGRPKGHGRDCLDAAHDLREVITFIKETCIGTSYIHVDSLRIVIVASSVACAIARLYAAEFPGTVVAMVLLDSTLANSDTVSLFPDPESPGFSASDLPAGVSPDLCADARKKIFPIYGSESRNPEGIWRGTLPTLLPHPDSPTLPRSKSGMPFVTVVEHDPEIFPLQVKKTVGLPTIMTKTYFDPAWHQYHIGLAQITSPEMSKGPIIAAGCGHLIQRDNPKLVASEIVEILGKLGQDTQSRL
ncbi:uncharacterized protein LY89DRAFT_753800 [Mollisia scopiformis]|uniref:AB hydrolase-1 domain-containing protein n=1 Tax=Mollisia scopiformis TaxID=149040 RepID=A0A194WZ61_MOLSC|nr:uncharacterized protein LY89DRAFT_753800 [Mollisia scopiformis]KUJ13241.1 hypothetical protein LY89DRAFT_753800 [Mollisia scopiformis]